MRPLIPLFWTSGDVYSGFHNQYDMLNIPQLSLDILTESTRNETAGVAKGSRFNTHWRICFYFDSS